MQMRVFPQQQQNECTFKNTQLLHKPSFYKLVQRQATPSPLLTTTATTTTTRTMQKKKKVINRHSTRAKQKKASPLHISLALEEGELGSEHTKIRTASVQSVPSLTLHFLFFLSPVALTEEATSGCYRKNKRGKVSHRPACEMPQNFSKMFFCL